MSAVPASPLRVLTVLALTLGFVVLVFLPACNTSCKAMEVRGLSTTCGGGARGYMWTGTGCIFTVACNCTGADCQRLYDTQDGCETAHIHCRPK